MPAAEPEIEPVEVAAALAWHNGDAEATIRTLLADCKHLREQFSTKTTFSGESEGRLPPFESFAKC
ncbi:hypothetical protein [Sinorhizobium sp. Sb3]|uniref:hypothetical protein n=1 Tax=Sinorhizobium/Ensifer group TaxID=227292 RepID=UPI0009E798B7|nr:hypothetical protein [Sinorhizobium sp. Sb3]